MVKKDESGVVKITIKKSSVTLPVASEVEFLRSE